MIENINAIYKSFQIIEQIDDRKKFKSTAPDIVSRVCDIPDIAIIRGHYNHDKQNDKRKLLHYLKPPSMRHIGITADKQLPYERRDHIDQEKQEDNNLKPRLLISSLQKADRKARVQQHIEHYCDIQHLIHALHFLLLHIVADLHE